MTDYLNGIEKEYNNVYIANCSFRWTPNKTSNLQQHHLHCLNKLSKQPIDMSTHRLPQIKSGPIRPTCPRLPFTIISCTASVMYSVSSPLNSRPYCRCRSRPDCRIRMGKSLWCLSLNWNGLNCVLSTLNSSYQSSSSKTSRSRVRKRPWTKTMSS